MRFQIPRDPAALSSYFVRFVAMAGADRWWKRIKQLECDAKRSHHQAKIVADHHWLEMELSTQVNILVDHGRTLQNEILPQSIASLLFAAMTVEVDQRLGELGRKNLRGRIRDSLQTDFAGLYLEFKMALALLDEGFDVAFPDLEGNGNFDLHFCRGDVEGELECKSLSADAGRKIHRRDFYRFMEALEPSMAQHLGAKRREIFLVTVDDRFPVEQSKQQQLRGAVSGMLTSSELRSFRGSFFGVRRLDFGKHFRGMELGDSEIFYSACRKKFGENCHAAGAMNASEGCVIVVRSKRQDDHTKPQLEALKKAATQFSTKRTGIVALQFEEIEPADLALSYLRRRSALLCNYFFHSRAVDHVAAVHFSAFSGVHHGCEGFAMPAFTLWNRNQYEAARRLPFRDGVADDEFARLLGRDPSEIAVDQSLGFKSKQRS